MDRGLYLRFATVVGVALLAGLQLWPTIDDWRVSSDPDAGRTAPELVTEWFSGRISPGLDIRGGLRLQYEVEVEEYIRDRRDTLSEQLVRKLGVLLEVYGENDADTATREQLEQVAEQVQVATLSGGLRATVTFTGSVPEAFDRDWLRDEGFGEMRIVSTTGNVVTLEMREDNLDTLRATAVQQAQHTVEERINTLGIAETTVMARDADIIVEVPGATEEQFERIRSIIARTARLEFKVLDDEGDYVAGLRDGLPEGVTMLVESTSAGEERPSVSVSYLFSPMAESEETSVAAYQRLEAYVATLDVPTGHELLLGEVGGPTARAQDRGWRTFYVFSSANVTGEDVEDAAVAFDPTQGNAPYVGLRFNTRGADRFEELTGRNVKRRMAIVLDDKVFSAPVINQRIGGGNAQITLGGGMGGQEAIEEANDLVVVLKAGALPAPLRPANEQLIGPTLGQDSIEKGGMGALIGIGLVLLMMALYYQVAGLVADAMVLLNVLLLLALMAALGATLTLPGVAAIALTVGMAVDANVLITERIREELRLGKSPRAAVDQGFSRAFSSIFDGQITTFIAGIVLFQFGTGPIKGFAVMLMLGIVTSLFTGIFCSRVMLDWIVRGLKVERLRVG
jgi:preprotein translocase subunit SecD